MEKDLALLGKRVLITGGSMGIGLACAEHARNAGARIMICARTKEPLDRALYTLREKSNGEVWGQIADISKKEDVNHLIDEMTERWGGVDGLVHCAAVQGPIRPVTEIDPEEWLDTIRINLFGTFLVTRRCCQTMKKQGGGRIVLLSGGGASNPFPNYTAYACSKVSVVRYAETLAEEMRPFHVQVNCVAPGFVLTRLHHATLAAGEAAGLDYLERTRREIVSGGVSPDIAARTIVFLLSDQARGITGKFVAAQHDRWDTWPMHLAELQKTDIFTLRRILPKDRGMDWQ